MYPTGDPDEVPAVLDASDGPVLNRHQLQRVNDAQIRGRHGVSWYLAGGMTGYPSFNYPAFDAAAADLRSRGYTMVSPAELDDEEGRAAAMASPDGSHDNDKTRPWSEYLIRDLHIVTDDVDGVIVLPGWAESSGATLETFVAMRLGKPVLGVYPSLNPILRHPYRRLEEWVEAGHLRA